MSKGPPQKTKASLEKLKKGHSENTVPFSKQSASTKLWDYYEAKLALTRDLWSTSPRKKENTSPTFRKRESTRLLQDRALTVLFFKVLRLCKGNCRGVRSFREVQFRHTRQSAGTAAPRVRSAFRYSAASCSEARSARSAFQAAARPGQSPSASKALASSRISRFAPTYNTTQ